jgi:hypothetical protein
MSTIHDSDRDGEALRHAPYVAREEVASTSPVQDGRPSLADRRETARPVSREDLPSLADRTTALASILEGLTYGLPISVRLDYLNSSGSRLTLQHPHGAYGDRDSLTIALKPNTLNLGLRGGRDNRREWSDVMAALNTMHAWITDTLGASGNDY